MEPREAQAPEIPEVDVDLGEEQFAKAKHGRQQGPVNQHELDMKSDHRCFSFLNLCRLLLTLIRYVVEQGNWITWISKARSRIRARTVIAEGPPWCRRGRIALAG